MKSILIIKHIKFFSFFFLYFISIQLCVGQEDEDDDYYYNKITIINKIDNLLEKNNIEPKSKIFDCKIKKYFNELWKHSLIRFISTDMRFQEFGKGEIIYIYGTSTVGKSTLCQLIQKYHTEIPILAGRDYKTKYFVSLLKKNFPEQYEIITKSMSNDDIITYLYFGDLKTKQDHDLDINNLKDNILYIKNNIKIIDKQFNSNNLLAALFTEAFRLSKMGMRVVIDNLDVDFLYQYIGTFNYNFPLRMVLLYSSPEELLTRVQIRNEKAVGNDNLNMRPCLRPLLTFAFLYKRTSCSFKCTESIRAEKLFKIYKKGYKADKRESPVWATHYTNNHKDMWHKLERLVRKRFKIHSITEVIKIGPRFPFHILINTKLNSPEKGLELMQLK